MIERASAVIVMGVSGTGKSTLGRKLAEVLEVPFLEGDDFHPPANLKKMSEGIALNDADRWPWLAALSLAVTARRTDAGLIATCSALKRSYRDALRKSIAPPLLFVCLVAQRATLEERMASRKNHFMPESLLDSQLADFELPDADEHSRLLCAELPTPALISQLLSAESVDSTTSPHRTAESS